MSIKFLNIVWQQKIRPNVKLVLLALADYCDDEGICFPSLETLVEKCGLSRSVVITHISELIKLKLLTKERQSDDRGYRRANLYKLNLPQSPKTLRRKIQRRESLRTETLSRDFESLSPDLPPSKVRISDGNIINHQEPSLEPSHKGEVETSPCSSKSNSNHTQKSFSECVEEIFRYWQKVMNHPKAKLDDKRQRKIKNALKSYSVDELKQAIDGCAATPFNMGENNERKRYDDIGLIFRDAEHIERFRDTIQKSENSNYDQITEGAL